MLKWERSSNFRLVFATLLAAACLFEAAIAHAGQACPIEISGDRRGAWERAARDVETKLADASMAGDCARILVRVEGRRAHVLFSTTDGRRGEREIRDPTELEATVFALATIHPIAPMSTDSETSNPSSIPTGGDEVIRPILHENPSRLAEQGSAAAALRLPYGPRPSVIYGVLAGGRAGAGGVGSPVLDTYAAFNFDHWDIGLIGRYETGYRTVGDGDAPRSSAIAAGAMVGRRLLLGPNVLLLAGCSLQIAALFYEDRRPNEDVRPIDSWTVNRGQSNAADAAFRFGAYLGLVLPRRSATRFRVNLTADASPPSTIEHDSRGTSLYPWWGAALAIGIELGGP